MKTTKTTGLGAGRWVGLRPGLDDTIVVTDDTSNETVHSDHVAALADYTQRGGLDFPNAVLVKRRHMRHYAFKRHPKMRAK